jgi:hypothetical protein
MKFTCPAQYCTFSVAYLPAEIPGEPIPHTCPYYGGLTHHGASVTITILDKKWRELEEIAKTLMALGRENKSSEIEYLRGKASGYAEVIAEFMRPYYNDQNTQEPSANLVLKETLVRIKERNAGNTEYVSPGQASRVFEAPAYSEEERAGKSKQEAGKSYKRALQLKTELTEQEVTACKTFFQNNFTIEQIAESLDVPIALVRKAVT